MSGKPTSKDRPSTTVKLAEKPAKGKRPRSKAAVSTDTASTRVRNQNRDEKPGAVTAATARLAPQSSPEIVDLGAKSAAPKPIGARSDVNTVVYVHGIGNKPPAAVLKCQWDTALFGGPIGDRSRMAYWVNREYYPTPLKETCASGDLIDLDDDEASTSVIMALAAGEPGNERKAIDREIKALTRDPERRAFLEKIARHMIAKADAVEAEVKTRSVDAKIFPLPRFARLLLASQLTRAFLRDVNDFLFVSERREAMEQAFVDRLNAGGGSFVVIAHSQGTMIAYDVLRRFSRQQVEVPLFVTIGSPLGMH